MAKYSNLNRLTRAQEQELLMDLARALASVRSSVEAVGLIRDLMSKQEVSMLARRLKIARLLCDGLKYEEIQRIIPVSNDTIARVNSWLRLYGDGYRLVIKRTKSRIDSKIINNSWSNHKNKYFGYYWPEQVLKNMMRHISEKEKKQLLAIVRITSL